MEIALVIGLFVIGAVIGALITVAFVIDPSDTRSRCFHDDNEHGGTPL